MAKSFYGDKTVGLIKLGYLINNAGKLAERTQFLLIEDSVTFCNHNFKANKILQIIRANKKKTKKKRFYITK